MGVVAALWNYIKMNGLQDKAHPTTIKFDQKLMQVRPSSSSISLLSLMSLQLFHTPEVPFNAIPELVMRFLAPADPIVLHHVINVDQPLGPNMQAFDIDVDMDDYVLKHKIGQTINYSAEAQAAITALDDEVCGHCLDNPFIFCAKRLSRLPRQPNLCGTPS